MAGSGNLKIYTTSPDRDDTELPLWSSSTFPLSFIVVRLQQLIRLDIPRRYYSKDRNVNAAALQLLQLVYCSVAAVAAVYYSPFLTPPAASFAHQ